LSTAAGARIHFDDYVRAEIDPVVRERIFYVGKKSADEISALRRASAFSITGSRFENFPYSLAEAMAMGTTSIVSDSFGNAEMVLDGETGLVVPTGDIDAMADAILLLHAQPDRNASMAAAAWQRCRSWLSPQRIASETVSLYEKAIDRAHCI
jgi:glycosyltransferase involved in cell wall biosynthesis